MNMKKLLHGLLGCLMMLDQMKWSWQGNCCLMVKQLWEVAETPTTNHKTGWRHFAGEIEAAASGLERIVRQLGIRPHTIVGRRIRPWLPSRWLGRLPTSWSWRMRRRSVYLS